MGFLEIKWKFQARFGGCRGLRAGTFGLAALCSALLQVFTPSHGLAGNEYVTPSENRSGTNLNLRFQLVPDSSNYFTLDEGTNLPNFTTRLTSLGGGSNGWRFMVLNPAGGIDPSLTALGGGTNAWNFAVSPKLPRLYWRVQRLTNSPAGTYFGVRYSLSDTNITLYFDLTPDTANYYILDAATNLTDFTPQIMAYGGGAGTWSASLSTVQVPKMLWRVRRLPTATALDTDGDGLDDVFELSHGLNPLDPSDANANSGFVDVNNNPLTWLGVYHYYFVNNIKIYDAVSREVSSFNFGQPTANYEAISREVSAFNVPGTDTNQDGIDDNYEVNHGITNASQLSGFTTDFPNNTGMPLTWLQIYRENFGENRTLYDAVSREVSAFNFGQPTANYEAVSRETSVFNFGQPAANYEALSREVSIFNSPPDQDGDGIDDTYELNHGIPAGGANQLSGFTSEFPNNTGQPLTWLQLYRENFGANRTLYDAVSREVSVFNFGQPTANYESVSREVSVFNEP